MSYAGISVREAMEQLNDINAGWYLPYIQRQYVWGARYESEEYVCLLLDSLIKRYPIGGLVLWETDKKVPYREFVNEYEPGKFTKQVEEGRWGAHKFLVYDGQQRLQTLRSVLYYTFNGRVLHFDLLFDATKAPTDDTGFMFRDRDSAPDPRYLKLTQLVSVPCEPRKKVELEYHLLEALRKTQEIGMEIEILIKTNLTPLWDIFVDTNEKSIAYFPVRGEDEADVNEVFRRLNIGGVLLTEVELVFGEIKKYNYEYEEKIWDLSSQIEQKSNGIEFSAAQILQFFHLLVKNTTRIDASRFAREDADKFLIALAHQDALVELFEGYLWGLFKINHASIVPRWLAVLPLGVYLASLKSAGREWRIKALTHDQVSAMSTYFLLAQFCDWNTQTMVNAFSSLAADAGGKGAVLPVEDFRKIAIEKNRTSVVSQQQFLALPWLALKMLTRSRTYVFHENKPQLDHIFPPGLPGADATYRELVDVLWNLQPIPDGINNYKRSRNPKEFFNSEDGTKYWPEYDFIPERSSDIWHDPGEFIQYRQKLMRQALLEGYRLKLQENQ